MTKNLYGFSIPLLIIILAVVSTVIIFFEISPKVLTNTIVNKDEKAKNIEIVEPAKSTEPSKSKEINEILSTADWTYKKADSCDVEFKIPPKEVPFYHPYNKDKLSDVTALEGSGRYWDFPRGNIWPTVLGILNTDFTVIATSYASPEEASGYSAGYVFVTCAPSKLQNFTDLLKDLDVKISEYNNKEYKGMGPDKYIINESTEIEMWDKSVLKLVINDRAYYVFISKGKIYEIAKGGDASHTFVSETADTIIKELKFN